MKEGERSGLFFFGRRGGFAFEFFDGGAVLDAGHLGHLVEDEDALEVIELVLDAAGEEAAGAEFEAFAVFVGGFDGDDGRTEDVAADVGETEAPFFVGFGRAFEGEELGIDEDHCVGGGAWRIGIRRIFVAGWDVEHEEGDGEADLRGGEADSVGVVHEFDHAFGDPAGLIGDFFDSLGGLSKSLFGIMQDRKVGDVDRHCPMVRSVENGS